MAIVKAEPSIYLDLFDDHLYGLGAETPDLPKGLLATVRMQLFLCILFGRRVAIPEQWLCSSWVFVMLASEILPAWAAARDRAFKRGQEPPPYPFEFCYFARSGTGQGQLAARALLDRLDRGRPIRLSSRLQGDGMQLRDPASAAARLRATLVESMDDGLPRLDDRFEAKVAESLGNSSLASALTATLRFAGVPESMHTPREDSAYHVFLSQAVQSVDTAIRQPKDVQLADSRTVAFRSFFADVRRSNIPFHDISGMWKVAETYGPRVRNTVTLMGRYCMHRGLARWTGAGTSSASYPVFSPETTEEYDLALLGAARTVDRQAQTVRIDGAAECDPSQLLVDRVLGYEDADLLTGQPELMSLLWTRAFDIAYSPEWKRDAAALCERFSAEQSSTHRAEMMRDFILGKLIARGVGLAIREDPSGDALFFARFKLGGDDPRALASAAAKAAFTYAMLGAGGWIGVTLAFVADLIGAKHAFVTPERYLQMRSILHLAR